MANNTGNPIGSTDAKDLSDNAESLDKLLNGEAYEYTDRLGRERKSLKWMEDAALAIPAIEAAQRSEQEAEKAVIAKSEAEAARDAAQLSAGVYPDVATGLANTPADKFFSVPSPESSEYLILYQNASGSPVEVKRYPSTEVLIGTKEVIAELSANAGPYRSNQASMEDIEPLFAFTQKDQHGDFYNLLAFMPDTSIQSAPLKKFVSAEIGGMAMQDVELGGWGGYVFAQRDANGVLYAVSGVREDGTQYLPGFNPGVSKGDLIHIVMLGQSNAAADDAKPALSTTPTGWDALMFSRGIATWNAADNPNTPGNRAGFSLVPMLASGVETRSNGMADAYKSRLTGASRFSSLAGSTDPDILVSFSGLGGRKLTEVGPEDDGASGRVGARTPGGHWPTMLDDIARGVAAAAAAGRAYRLPAWVYDQGESEGDMAMYYGGATLTPSALVASYTTKALTMVNQFDAQARVITGQKRPIPLFVTPPTYNQYTPTAWLDVSDASSLVFIVGPRYQMPSAKNASNGLAGASQNWGNEIHYAPDGQRWIGEMCAKVMHRVLNEGEDWQPLRVLSASKMDATHIDLTFHVPRPPLVIDTSLMPKAKGFGVTIYGGTIDAVVGPRISATSAELLPDGRTVRMTFPSIPVGALLSLGQSTCDFPVMTVAAVGTGAPTDSGFETYTVSIAGDIRPTLKALTDEGAFWLTALLPNGTPTAQGVARGVTFDGTNTVLIGETRELRTGAGYGPFVAGDTLTLRRMNPYTNFRDSDNLLSLNTFAAGPRTGMPYPLHNWACQYEAMTIQGA